MARVVPIRRTASPSPSRKKTIPKALKEQVWLQHVGTAFSSKCKTSWCTNIMNVFDYHTSHIVAEALGGPTDIGNLIPLCAKCNLSMGTMSFDDWSRLSTISGATNPVMINTPIIAIAAGSPASYASATVPIVPLGSPSCFCRR